MYQSFEVTIFFWHRLFQYISLRAICMQTLLRNQISRDFLALNLLQVESHLAYSLFHMKYDLKGQVFHETLLKISPTIETLCFES